MNCILTTPAHPERMAVYEYVRAHPRCTYRDICAGLPDWDDKTLRQAVVKLSRYWIRPTGKSPLTHTVMWVVVR